MAEIGEVVIPVHLKFQGAEGLPVDSYAPAGRGKRQVAEMMQSLPPTAIKAKNRRTALMAAAMLFSRRDQVVTNITHESVEIAALRYEKWLNRG